MWGKTHWIQSGSRKNSSSLRAGASVPGRLAFFLLFLEGDVDDDDLDLVLEELDGLGPTTSRLRSSLTSDDRCRLGFLPASAVGLVPFSFFDGILS